VIRRPDSGDRVSDKKITKPQPGPDNCLDRAASYESLNGREF